MSDRHLFAGAFLALAALHCVSYQPGIEVELSVAGAPPTLAFANEQGAEIRLEEALLHVEAIELRSCARANRWRWGSTARAHGGSGGNGPWKLDLASGGVIGEVLRPAPGEYCSVVVHVDGLSFGAVAARMAGREDGEPLQEEHAAPFDIELVLEGPLVLDDPSDRPSAAVTIDQRQLFDDEAAPLPERLERAASVTIRH